MPDSAVTPSALQPAAAASRRRLPIGAELVDTRTTHVHVWAPRASRVEVCDAGGRDAAYHQGTVWGWLVGPFIDAWLEVYPNDVAGARRALDGFIPHLDEACIESISDVFDAEPPFMARGCIAQAWSVAEVLRAWVKLDMVL